MAIKESALSLITSIAQGDWIRAVTSVGASRRVTVANLAKAIVESYTGSSLAGSSQSVKSAIDSINSNLTPQTYTLTKTDKIGNFESLCKRSGNFVSGSIIFSPNETLGNDFIANGLPPAYGGQQFPLICVAGSSDQKGLVGRARINGDAIQIWYSNITPVSGNTYFIPINYICP